MSATSREALVPSSFVLGSIGMILLGVHWWATGRRRDYFAFIAIVLAAATCGSFLWRFTAEELGGVLALILINAGLTVSLLALQVLFSRPGGVWAYQYEHIAEELRSLPEDRRRELLEDRERMIDILAGKGRIDRAAVPRLQSLPLGDLWTQEPRFIGKQV